MCAAQRPPDLAGVGGRYFEDCGEAEVVDEIADGLHGVRDYALDPAAAKRLWDVSNGLLSAARRALGSSSLAVVERLVRAIADGRSDEVRRLLTPDAVFVNETVGTLTGAGDIVATLDAAGEGMDGVDWRLVRSCAPPPGGTTVFTERLDRFGRRGEWAEIPVTGCSRSPTAA